MGIELGSTRVKSLLLDEDGHLLAEGSASWKSENVDGLWTYGYDEVENKLKESLHDLKKKISPFPSISSIGISAMMHGYIALNKNNEPISPFITWQNTWSEQEARELSSLLSFHIPARWSVAHLYKYIKKANPHLKEVTHILTLASYVHYLLTGEIAIGMGDASGMFPLSPISKDYDERMLALFDENAKKHGFDKPLKSLLPAIHPCNEFVGKLNERGAALLELDQGIPLVAPEGDSSTGLVSTNSLAAGNCSISVGTSVFLMAPLEKSLSHPREEIDIVFSPAGQEVAMVHCNNCSLEINEKVSLVEEALALFGHKEDKGKIYETLFEEAQKGGEGVVSIPYRSGESITSIAEGHPLLITDPSYKTSIASIMKAELFSSFATLSIGTKILLEEGGEVKLAFAQGGLFSSSDYPQKVLSMALKVPVTVQEGSSLGGPYAMAILALYPFHQEVPLSEFVSPFVAKGSKIIEATEEEKEEYRLYLRKFEKALALEKLLDEKKEVGTAKILKLRKEVYDANMDLYRSGLIIYTWGNVSGIDRDLGLIAIKPSGVPYESMKEEDIVILDLEGNKVMGSLSPSSDTPTHLEIYKEHPEVKGIVHTHSVFAVAFAQAGKDIVSYGTTHADYFHGDVKCLRALSEEEISSEYEKNTGKVINEYLKGKDALEVPAVLVKNHGPFTFGSSPSEALYHARVLEEVAKMAYLSQGINPDISRVDQYLLDKHYNRKHGKDAYYGQKGEKE